MNRHLRLLLVLAIAGLARAEVVEYPAEWLNEHSLTVNAGDQVRILGNETQRSVNLGNLNWLGGELSLVGCRMTVASGNRTLEDFPMVVSLGQTLNLEQTWIEGAAHAITLDGGDANLNQVTIASTECNISSQHPSSNLVLENVNLCNAPLSLNLGTCNSALIQSSLFLTNGTALRCGSAAQIEIQDCLFQGNERAITIDSTGTLPVFGPNVDLVGARYSLVDNQSLIPVDMADAYVDDEGKLTGAWIRSGVKPDVPTHPLKQSVGPIIIDDQDLDEFVLIMSVNTTIDGIPCLVNSFNLYSSINPYSSFTFHSKRSPENVSLPNFHSQNAIFFKATACIGSWE